MGDLRVGVGAPRNRQGAQTLAAEEQRVLDHDARRGVGGMRELVFQADVAGRVDARIGGLQEIVDPDAGRLS